MSMKFCRALFTLLVLCAIGCGTSKVPVSGTVTYKGQPVADSNVIFTGAGGGEAAGKTATGRTDAQGNFTLGTDAPADGAVPGDYVVSVVPNMPEPKEGDYSAAPPPPFPARYMNATGSDLKATVKSGADNKFPLELKD
jgi:hypothetical protein